MSKNEKKIIFCIVLISTIILYIKISFTNETQYNNKIEYTNNNKNILIDNASKNNTDLHSSDKKGEFHLNEKNNNYLTNNYLTKETNIIKKNEQLKKPTNKETTEEETSENIVKVNDNKKEEMESIIYYGTKSKELESAIDYYITNSDKYTLYDMLQVLINRNDTPKETNNYLIKTIIEINEFDKIELINSFENSYFFQNLKKEERQEIYKLIDEEFN